MTIIDISQKFFSCRVYPGDSPPSFERVKAIERDGHNLTTVSMNVHNGTHIDAPLHFVAGGKAIHELDLSLFCGPCTVAEMSGIINGSDIMGVIETCHERLLLKGMCELSDAAAALIAKSHVKLIGVESQTIGKTGSPKQIHLTLLEKEIIPLEGLDLSKAQPGDYTLYAFPLNMQDSDGSPVRAILIQSGSQIEENRNFMKCPNIEGIMPCTDESDSG